MIWSAFNNKNQKDEDISIALGPNYSFKKFNSMKEILDFGSKEFLNSLNQFIAKNPITCCPLYKRSSD
jgi:hypothetical protein